MHRSWEKRFFIDVSIQPMKLYLILLKKTISDSYISTKVIFELSSRVFNNKLFDCYNNLMGRKRNETIMRGIREKNFFYD